MPKINAGEIEFSTYVDKEKEYLIDQQIGEDTEDLITKLITNYKETLSGIDDVIVKYLDEESCVINDQPLLNKLAKKIQNDIKKTSEVIDDFKTQFVNQVTDHKAQEANETYRKTMEEYDRRKKGFTIKKDLYNKTRKQDEDIDGSYKTILPEAYFNPGSDNAAPKLSFGVGNKYDSKEQKVLQTVFDTQVLDFYNNYVTVAVDLKNEYGSNGGHNEIKSKFKEFTEISKAITNPNTASSSKKDTNTSKTKTDIDGFIKDTPVYFVDGYCYTKDKDGNLQEVYYLVNGVKTQLTKEEFLNKTNNHTLWYKTIKGKEKPNYRLRNIRIAKNVINGSEFVPMYTAVRNKGLPSETSKTIYKYGDDYYYQNDDGEMIKQNVFKDYNKDTGTWSIHSLSEEAYNNQVEIEGVAKSNYQAPTPGQAKIQLKNGNGTFDDVYTIEKIKTDKIPNGVYIQTDDGKNYCEEDNKK